MQIKSLTYPPAPSVPVKENVGGITYDDPYRWLEEESEEIQAWQDAEDALAEAYLRDWDGYESLKRHLSALAPSREVIAPLHHGPYWFRLEVPAGRGRAMLIVASVPGEQGRVLVDPNAMGDEQPHTIDWFHPSPDGSYVAFGLSAVGNEQSTLQVIETQSGQSLPARIPFTAHSIVVWLPDSSAFYYRGTAGNAQQNPQEYLYFHRLGETGQRAPEPIAYSELMCFPQIADDGRYVAVIMGELEPRPYWIKELPGGAWRPFLRDVEGMCYGVFAGDRYIAVDRGGFSRGRLISIPVATVDDRSTWRELIGESDAVLHGVSKVGDRLVLSELVDARSRLTITDLEGRRQGEIPLPGIGIAGPTGDSIIHVWTPMIIPSSGVGEVTFTFQTLTSSPASYRYDLDSGELEQILEPATQVGGMTVRFGFCASADGTSVPYYVLYRSDLDLSRPWPALVHAYGGFNYAFLPAFRSDLLAFARTGGIVALVCARGGSEYGTDWWRQGRMRHKQNTFNDVYAAVEQLIADGLTAPGRVGFVGGSNGGLLAGAAITQRPDLFGAVVPMVPVLDLMHLWRDEWLGRVCAMEYGDPRNPEEAAVLFAYSPYHNVRDGVSYPATLVVAGESDVRCPLWHSRKFVARLQNATSGDSPILLRVWKQTGHGT
ncbi:MAG: prolyl oligopeptidase family serine peptidase, partial [Chloroflexota bacterium]